MRRGLIESKHVSAMGEAVWLFLVLVDWQTDDEGWIAGCTPITWKQLRYRLGKSKSTLQRWKRILEGQNREEKCYIETRQTQRGIYFRILDQKKRTDGPPRGKKPA